MSKTGVSRRFARIARNVLVGVLSFLFLTVCVLIPNAFAQGEQAFGPSEVPVDESGNFTLAWSIPAGEGEFLALFLNGRLTEHHDVAKQTSLPLQIDPEILLNGENVFYAAITSLSEAQLAELDLLSLAPDTDTGDESAVEPEEDSSSPGESEESAAAPSASESEGVPGSEAASSGSTAVSGGDASLENITEEDSAEADASGGGESAALKDTIVIETPAEDTLVLHKITFVAKTDEAPSGTGSASDTTSGSDIRTALLNPPSAVPSIVSSGGPAAPLEIVEDPESNWLAELDVLSATDDDNGKTVTLTFYTNKEVLSVSEITGEMAGLSLDAFHSMPVPGDGSPYQNQVYLTIEIVPGMVPGDSLTFGLTIEAGTEDEPDNLTIDSTSTGLSVFYTVELNSVNFAVNFKNGNSEHGQFAYQSDKIILEISFPDGLPQGVGFDDSSTASFIQGNSGTWAEEDDKYTLTIDSYQPPTGFTAGNLISYQFTLRNQVDKSVSLTYTQAQLTAEESAQLVYITDTTELDITSDYADFLGLGNNNKHTAVKSSVLEFEFPLWGDMTGRLDENNCVAIIATADDSVHIPIQGFNISSTPVWFSFSKTIVTGKIPLDNSQMTTLGLSHNETFSVSIQYTITGKTPQTLVAANRITYKKLADSMSDTDRSITMVSSNGLDGTLAKKGDTVTFEFNHNELTNGEFYAQVNGNRSTSAFKPIKAADRGTHIDIIYETVVTLNDTADMEVYDNKTLPLHILDTAGGTIFRYDPIDNPGTAGSIVENTDMQGNTVTGVLFYGKLKVTGLSFSTSAGGNIAGNGYTVELTITSNHPADLTAATIAGLDVFAGSASTGSNPAGSTIWKAYLTLPSGGSPTGYTLAGKDNIFIDFSFQFQDKTKQSFGYSFEPESETGATPPAGVDAGDISVLYYAPIALYDTAMNSNNASSNPKVTRNGDEITVSFETTHPVQIESGSKVGAYTLTSGDTNAFTATGDNATRKERYQYIWAFPVNPGTLALSDLATIELLLNIEDGVNPGFTFDSSDPAGGNSAGFEKVRYYVPIVITDVVIATNNAKDPTQYAKDGDTVTVSFVSNHMVSLSGSIAGVPVSSFQPDTDDSLATDIKWTYSYTLVNGNLADLSTVPFGFTANDAALNDPVSCSEGMAGVTNQIKYYEPIEATAGISSGNARPQFAKNGDTVTVLAKTNHESSIISSLIASRAGTSHNNLTLTPSASYTIPGGEGSIAEGVLSFAIKLEDPAGNILDVNKTNDAGPSQVTYDRTAPVVALLPVYSGFTNKAISFMVVYSDEHIDSGAMSFLVNDIEYLTGTDRAIAGSAKVFSKNIEITADSEYRLRGTITDMAGNRNVLDATANVILDTKGPVIKIGLDKNTYISGTTPNQIFSIEELYIKEVICSITDNDGVNDWDMDEPLVTEGKKTVFLTAEDMAGNTAVPLSYDVYIDGTAPDVVVNETVSAIPLAAGVNAFSGKEAVLSVKLSPINIGDEEPDKFTLLQLLDADRTLVQDLLSSGADSDSFTVTLPNHGIYTLLIEAEDEVGNVTGRLEYKIDFSENGIIPILPPLISPDEIFRENKPLFFTLVIGIPLLGIGGIVLGVRRVRMRKGAKKSK